MTKEKRIQVLKVAPMEAPEPIVLDNDLDSLQKAVSVGTDYQGLIELIGFEQGIDLLCNEEGKLISLPLNRRVGNDIIAGVFYVVGVDREGNLCSLPADKMQEYRERFAEIECYENISFDDLMYMRFVGI